MDKDKLILSAVMATLVDAFEYNPKKIRNNDGRQT